MKPSYTLRLDREMLDKYLALYFKEYPNRRKIPITEPFPPSLNRYLTMSPQARNTLKQNWQDFVYVAVKEQGLMNLNLDYVSVKITYIFGDKRKSDLDNRKRYAAFVQ